MSRSAFVTGATGFVGINLVRELVARDWQVTALKRESSELRYLEGVPVSWAVGDITDRASLTTAMPQGVEAVFHVAASLNLWARGNAEQTRINVDGTRNVVQTALENAARRFVHTSSVSAYGMQSGRIDESAPQLGGGSWINYQRTKFLAEEEVRKGIARGLQAVIVNPPNIVGPYDRTGWARLIKMVRAGTLPAIPPGANSFSHVREVARALIAAAEKGRVGENYFLGGTEATYVEAVRIIGELAGKPVPKRAAPPWLLKAYARLLSLGAPFTGREPRATPEAVALVSRRLYFDCSKAQRELDYKVVPLREMIADSYRWLEENGELDRA